jgi:hypothetical protein
MCKSPPYQTLTQLSKTLEMHKLFQGNKDLVQKNKEAAKLHLLQIQLMLAKHPIK